jgi:hypothetical protein
MKKLFLMMIAFSFLLAGCDKEMESLEVDNAALKSAGTRNLKMPILLMLSVYIVCLPSKHLGLEGSRQMELWMGVGNAKAGTLVGYVRFEPGKVIIDLTDTLIRMVRQTCIRMLSKKFIFTLQVPKGSGIPQTKNGNPIPGKFRIQHYTGELWN